MAEVDDSKQKRIAEAKAAWRDAVAAAKPPKKEAVEGLKPKKQQITHVEKTSSHPDMSGNDDDSQDDCDGVSGILSDE
jgi:hypothetical protein